MTETEPWQQASEEPALWFTRFTTWLHRKPRSVLATYNAEREKAGKKRSATYPSSWQEAKGKYRWAERAAAWDKAEQERLDRELAEQRESERQEELKIAAELREKARALLALPVVYEEVKRDRNGEEIAWLLIPEFRAFKAASDMFGQAKNHARAALMMPDKVERQEVTGKDGVPVETSHPTLTPEERLEKLIDLARQVNEQREHYSVH